MFRVYREPIVFAPKKIDGIVKSLRNLRLRLTLTKGSRRGWEKRKLMRRLEWGSGREEEKKVTFENLLLLEKLSIMLFPSLSKMLRTFKWCLKLGNEVV
jgi:hypothetical protein